MSSGETGYYSSESDTSDEEISLTDNSENFFIKNELKLFPLTIKINGDAVEPDQKDIRFFTSVLQEICSKTFEMRKENFLTCIYRHENSTIFMFPKCYTKISNMGEDSRFIATLLYVMSNEKWNIPFEHDSLDYNFFNNDEEERIPIERDDFKFIFKLLTKENRDNAENLSNTEYEVEFSENEIKPLKSKVGEIKDDIKTIDGLTAINDYNNFINTICSELLPIIKESRYNTEDNQTRLACALFNSSKYLLNLAKEYCGDIEELWQAWIEDPLLIPYRHGYRSILRWALADDKEETKKILNNNMDCLTDMALEPCSSVREIAVILFTDVCGTFVCSNPGKNIWWVFETTYFREISDPVEIRNIIDGNTRNLFRKALNRISTEIEKHKNASSQIIGSIKAKRDKATKIIRDLGEPGYKRKIINELADLCYEKDFELQLNKKMHLFSFDNCVYNTITGEIEDGKPTDYLSKSCLYNYVDYSIDHGDIKWWYEVFIDKVLPADYHTLDGERVYNEFGHDIHHKVGDPVYKYSEEQMERDSIKNIRIGKDKDCESVFNTRDWLMMRHSTSLGQGADMKELTIVTGNTNNSKSILDFIMKHMHGDWSFTFPMSILFSKRIISGDPSAATAHWEICRNGKYGSITEPEQGMTMLSSIIKLLVSGGSDPIYSRDLNQTAKNAKKNPLYILGLIAMYCNGIPQIDGSDPAIVERVKVLKLFSKFDKSAPKDPIEQKRQNHYPRDDYIKGKIRKKIAAWTWIMIQYHKKYLKKREEGIKEPETVKLATGAYITINDPVKSFLSDNFNIIHKKKNQEYLEYEKEKRKHSIPLGTLYQKFRTYCESQLNCDSKEIIKRDPFKQKLAEKGVYVIKTKIHGIKYKQTNDK